LEPLSRFSYDELRNYHRLFLEEKIRPIISSDAIKQVEKHRDQGDILLVLTATNRFITSPIVAEFGIENLLATEIEFIDERYTGKVLGKPCFQEGKIEHLKRWIGNRNISLDGSHFYSDSHNDLPTLELVDYPNVVNPDNKLREIALKRNWPIHNWT
jgi:HAD superfamily hydrolase (TIGR01490 family)